MSKSADILKDPQASGVYFIKGAFRVSDLEELAGSRSLTFFHVRGTEIDGKDRFLSQAATALAFPEYFGNNWDAFEDCLTDMSWHEAKGFVVLFDHIDGFAGRSAEDFQTAVAILKDVAEFWRNRGKTFLAFLSGTGADRWGLPSVML